MCIGEGQTANPLMSHTTFLQLCFANLDFRATIINNKFISNGLIKIKAMKWNKVAAITLKKRRIKAHQVDPSPRSSTPPEFSLPKSLMAVRKGETKTKFRYI